MAEWVRRKLNWSSWSRFEQLTLLSCLLVWLGVALFGVGLYRALRNNRLDQTAYAEATEMATAMVVTETPTPSATPRLYPAGWATATPTVTPTHRAASGSTGTRPDLSGVLPMVTLPAASSASTLSPSPAGAASPSKRTPQPTVRSGPPPAADPPDRLSIPVIKLDAPIVPVDSYTVEEDGEQYNVWQVADRVVGWHNTSVYPGHIGNMVLNGHHNIRGQVFRDLIDLKVGNRVLIYVQDQVYHYAITEKLILKEKGEPAHVRRDNARWIASTEDERLTMVTCWPYTNNTHRLVIVAKPVSPLPGRLEE